MDTSAASPVALTTRNTMQPYTAHPDQALHSPVLERAIEQWERGGTIPLTLAVELMAEGFDVEKLESEYRT